MAGDRIRARWSWRWTLAALAAAVALVTLRPLLEHVVGERIIASANRHGLVARLGRVRIGAWPLLRLEAIDLDAGHGLKVHADTLAVTWPGHLRVAVGPVTLEGPAGLVVQSRATSWRVSGLVGQDLQLDLEAPVGGLAIRTARDPLDQAGSTWTLEAHALDIGPWLDVRREGRVLFSGGVAQGRVAILADGGAGALHFTMDTDLRGVRLGALVDDAAEALALGEPTDAGLRCEGAWLRGAGRLEVPRFEAHVAGARASGTLALRGLGADPVIDFALDVPRLRFAELLAASGLRLPAGMEAAPGAGNDLGSVAIQLRVGGRLSDPAALKATQRIDYHPPRALLPAITRLRGDFTYGADGQGGVAQPIEVSPAAPDFIALRDVPPLFIRTLLLSEDAGFYGHPGIDLRELPAALATNWTRGGAARGASTITQQLAKNLFLTRERQVGRKLQELPIAFQLESALGKQRILEIYLNIIEWGPGLRGLRPAARAYFGREPRALTPAQVAFLVAIIPGPIKYQASFAHGTPGPGLRALVDALLAKMRSVDAIGEEDYQRALAEPLVVKDRGPP